MVFTNYRPKSHKIKEFGGMVKRFSMELTTVFPQNTDTEKECFDLLCVLTLKLAITKISYLTRTTGISYFPCRYSARCY